MAEERKYHDTESVYALPNDDIEQKRLDMQANAIIEMIGGKPFLGLDAVSDVKAAVDVGCGTGAATLQLAARFPNAQVYGLDLSPVSETVQKLAAPNVTFAVGNVLKDDDAVAQGILAPNSLDYIFGRMLVLGIDNWDAYFANAAKALRPGGIVEHQDADFTGLFRSGTGEYLGQDWEWVRRMNEAAQKMGLNNTAGSDAAEHMRKAGLEVVSRQGPFEFQLRPTPKVPASQAIGRYCQEKVAPTFPMLLAKMYAVLGLEKEEVERLSEECLRTLVTEVEEGAHWRFWVTVARKV